MKTFEEEYRQNIKAVFAFLMASTGDHHLSEELTQETFYRAYRAIDRFRGECKVSVWLCQIAKHCLIDYQKKEKRHVSMAQVEQKGQSPSADDVFAQHEEARVLYRTIAGLPPPYREVLMLHCLGQMPYRDIAAVFEKSESWARVTCFRAKERLTKALEGAKK